MAGDFSVIVKPYFWKQIKNDDDDALNPVKLLMCFNNFDSFF